jgi:hypothetical protein
LDLWRKNVVAVGACTAPLRLALERCMSSIPRRGDLQDLADRLDPERIAMLVDKLS